MGDDSRTCGRARDRQERDHARYDPSTRLVKWQLEKHSGVHFRAIAARIPAALATGASNVRSTRPLIRATARVPRRARPCRRRLALDAALKATDVVRWLRLIHSVPGGAGWQRATRASAGAQTTGRAATVHFAVGECVQPNAALPTRSPRQPADNGGGRAAPRAFVHRGRLQIIHPLDAGVRVQFRARFGPAARIVVSTRRTCSRRSLGPETSAPAGAALMTR